MLKNMRINKRLIVTFVVAVLISSIAGLVGMGLLLKIDGDYGKTLVNYGFAQGDIGNLGRHFQKQRATTLYLLLSTNKADVDNYTAELATVDATIESDMVQVNKGLNSELGQQTYAKLTAAWNS